MFPQLPPLRGEKAWDLSTAPAEPYVQSPGPQPPQATPPSGLLNLDDGFGGYMGYMFQLTPEQLHTVKEIVIDSIIREVSSLRGKP